MKRLILVSLETIMEVGTVSSWVFIGDRNSSPPIYLSWVPVITVTPGSFYILINPWIHPSIPISHLYTLQQSHHYYPLDDSAPGVPNNNASSICWGTITFIIHTPDIYRDEPPVERGNSEWGSSRVKIPREYIEWCLDAGNLQQGEASICIS